MAAGDVACPPAEPATAETCRQADTAALIERLDPDAVLPLGDDQYEAGTLEEFRGSYAGTWGRFLSISYPTPGNAEYRTEGAAGYLAYFGERAAPNGVPYYSFELGGWHVLSLDWNCRKGCVPGSAMYGWLEGDLSASGANCTLAYWHVPRFSSHPEGSSEQYAAIWSLLYEHGVEVVLSGHHHHYERFAPLDPDGAVDAAAGIREFVVGTGGRSLAPFADPLPGSEVRDASSFGVLALTLEPGSYAWEFVPVGSAGITDRGNGTCH